ncbi:hypothetical protein Tcan_18683 [Toxocara canis]|uniref:Uncharacterized protein n=1 Tax=Toxocara canis TaxID=6265 RepID=A0A0B2USN6_TOXCA|nr:hypothetical protein Tcan_18683 [Toxocara canis]
MRKTMEQMMTTMVEEIRKFLTATIQDILGSIIPETVKTPALSLNSIHSPDSERPPFQHTFGSPQQPKNGSSIATDAEEQQRRLSAVFIGVEESSELPHLRHDRDVESVTVILDELNVDSVPVEVYRMGVFNPMKRRPIKVIFRNSHDAVQVLRQCRMLKQSPRFSSIYIRPSYSAAIRKELFTKRREDPNGIYAVRNNLVVRRGSAVPGNPTSDTPENQLGAGYRRQGSKYFTLASALSLLR